METKTRELLEELVRELNTEKLQVNEATVQDEPDINEKLPAVLIAPLYNLLLQARAMDDGYRQFYLSLKQEEVDLEDYSMPLDFYTDFVKLVFEAVHGREPEHEEFVAIQTTILDEEKYDKWYSAE